MVLRQTKVFVLTSFISGQMSGKNLVPDIDTEANPAFQRGHLLSFLVVNGVDTPAPGSRVYFPHTPQIETGQMVGISAFIAVRGVGTSPNISQFAPVPIGSQNVENGVGFEISSLLTISLVSKSGEVLFQQTPVNLLFPIQGKVHRYNAVNLDSRASYVQWPGALPVISGTAYNINLMFYMNYQNL